MVVWLVSGIDAGNCRLVDGLAMDEGSVCAWDDVVPALAGITSQGFRAGQKSGDRPTLPDDERGAYAFVGGDRCFGHCEVLID